LDSSTALVPFCTMVMVDANGTLKRGLAIMVLAQDLVVTLNSLLGHLAPSLVFLKALRLFTSNTVLSI
jgi:hypothetical protein